MKLGRFFRFYATLLAGLYLWTLAAHAQDATWTGASSAFWAIDANWNPQTIPTGIATFAGANPNIDISASASIGTLHFAAGTPVAYSFTNGGVFVITGAGIVNDSPNRPSITNGIFHIGFIDFENASTAGNAIITNNATLDFLGMSNAGTATITTDSGASTFFSENSTGGMTRFITNAGGTFDISGLTAPGMTAGSIEGAGTYNLGSRELTVGLNNLSTTVSGLIEDAGGSLIKIGTGTLTLLGTNTYSGGTSFNEGIVAINNDANLGTGPLSFDGGTLEAAAAGGGIT